MGDVPSHVQNRLKKYRRIAGYSQKEVARLLGYKSASRLSRWERGTSIPTLRNILKLSFLYSTLPAELYPEVWEEIRLELKEKKLKSKE